MLHKETVSKELIEVTKALMDMDQLNSFQLVGGTAIALQIGHRKSIDIDLFSTKKTDLLRIKRSLTDSFSKISNVVLTQNCVRAEINGVRVDIFDDWSIPFRRNQIIEEGIRLTALEDLAAFKLSTITGRREKKDYIDLFFLFKKFGAKSILKEFEKYEPLLSAKSLMFALTEVVTAKENKSPMPDMHIKIEWKEVTESMLQAAQTYIEIKKTEPKNRNLGL